MCGLRKALLDMSVSLKCLPLRLSSWNLASLAYISSVASAKRPFDTDDAPTTSAGSGSPEGLGGMPQFSTPSMSGGHNRARRRASSSSGSTCTRERDVPGPSGKWEVDVGGGGSLEDDAPVSDRSGVGMALDGPA